MVFSVWRTPTMTCESMLPCRCILRSVSRMWVTSDSFSVSVRRRPAAIASVEVFQSFLAVARRVWPPSVQQSLSSSAPQVAPRLPPKHTSPAASTAAMAALVNFTVIGHKLAPSAFLPLPSPESGEGLGLGLGLGTPAAPPQAGNGSCVT